ncbi:MAG: hypothetical protein JO362_09190 [Streptomycetaceae bacterium]|nr:hypothetical protein [Streptomycetaceae bacterium]
MDESRQSSSSVGTALHNFVPPPALCGFLLLLALMFAVSYAIGTAAGPVAPGMHATSGGGSRGMEDMPGGGH